MLIEFFIKTVYRKYIKNIFPNRFNKRCVFYPSCSEYAHIAFKKYSFFDACRKSINRIKSCDGNHISFGTIDKP